MKKLLEFQKLISTIKKDAKNPHFKNNYATLTQILSEVKPVLNEVGLILIQPTIDGKCQTILIDPENGETIQSELTLPTNLNPQQMGGALTYYRRYLLAGLLSLEIADDDGQMASTKKELPTLTDERFEKALESLAKGLTTIEKIKANFKLTKEQEAQLC